MELKTAIQSFYYMNKRMPTNADDLKPFFNGKVAKRIQGGAIAVDWNSLTVKDEIRDPRRVILAWETDRRGEEMLVLFMDGAVEHINDNEFFAMPKAEENKDKK